MTNLTIRIDEELKKQAAILAKKLGIPLSLVIKNALRNFIQDPQLTVRGKSLKKTSTDLEGKMESIFYLMNQNRIADFSPFQGDQIPITQINAESSSFDFLADEPDLYSMDDLKEIYV